MSTTDTQTDSVPHARYHETNRKAYDSQQAVADAWADGAYPTHNDGELYSSPNFRGIQNRDGSGRLLHYRTREAIRTRSGLTISNQQCWSGGFAHCSLPDELDATLPLAAIEQFLDDGDAIYAIDRVVDGIQTYEAYDGSEYESARAENSIAVIEPHNDRETYGIAIGFDPSGVGRGNRYFAFRVEAGDVAAAERVGAERVITLLLTPTAVRRSGLPVVSADEYAKSRLDEDEAAAHRAAGGNVREREQYGRTVYQTLQHYRADLRGEVIVRHGEWFFIPEPGADPEEVGSRYAGERLGSHRSLRSNGAHSPLPTECAHDRCRSVHLHVDDEGGVSCAECWRTVERPVYVRGDVIHAEGDHNAANLGDVWHRAVTHGRDALTYDTSPGRGRGSRGGWD